MLHTANDYSRFELVELVDQIVREYNDPDGDGWDGETIEERLKIILTDWGLI